MVTLENGCAINVIITKTDAKVRLNTNKKETAKSKIIKFSPDHFFSNAPSWRATASATNECTRSPRSNGELKKKVAEEGKILRSP